MPIDRFTADVRALFPRVLALILVFGCIAAAPALDLNGDGLSDVWQQRYGAGSLAPLTDTDGDTFSNASEENAGTDPFDPLDHPKLGPLSAESDGDPVFLSFPTKIGKSYQVLESINLREYTPLGAPFQGHGQTIALSIHGTAKSEQAAGVRHEQWAKLSGNLLATLTGLATFPNSPDGVSTIERFETPRVVASGFGGRLRALITPPRSGDYTFSLSSGGAAELHLSTDASIPNLAKQAEVLSAQTDIAPGAWDTHANQQSPPIALVAGTPYLLEVRYVASVSRSHCQIAWSGPGIAGFEPLPASSIVPATFLPQNVPARPLYSHDYDAAGQTGPIWPANTTVAAAPAGMSGNAETIIGDPGGRSEEIVSFTTPTSAHLYATWLFNMAADHNNFSLYFIDSASDTFEGPRIDIEEGNSGTQATIRGGGASATEVEFEVTFGDTYRVEIVASLAPGGFQYQADLATMTVAEDTFDMYVSDANGHLLASATGLSFRDAGADLIQKFDAMRARNIVDSNLTLDDWEITGGSIAGNGYLRSNISSFTLSSAQQFFRVGVSDADQDGDGIPDWEEMELATHHPFLFFDPDSTAGTSDGAALNTLLSGISGPTEVALAASDTAAFESNLPNLGSDHGEITVYRTGPLTPVTVNICQLPLADSGNTETICDGTCCTLVGSAGDEEAEAEDYTITDEDGNVITNRLRFAFGEMVKVLTVKASPDTLNEYPETLNVALEPVDDGSYQVSETTNGASIQLFDLPEHPDNVAIFTGTYSQDGAAVIASDGSGFVTATLNGPRTELLLWSEFSGTTSAQQDSHIHKSGSGPSPGAIIYAITNVPGDESGNSPDSDPLLGPLTAYPWDITSSSGAVPSAGGAASKQTIIDSLFGQNGETSLYLNIHTVDNPAGEIWAFLNLSGGSQVEPDPPSPAAAPGSAGYPQLAGEELEGEVRRFLNQATFGATDSEVATIVAAIETERLSDPSYHRHTAFAAWIDDQMNPAVTPQTHQLDYHMATDWQYYVLGGAFDPARNPSGDGKTTPTLPAVWPSIDRSDPNPEHWHLDLAYPVTRDDLRLLDFNNLKAEPGNNNRRQANWQMMLNARDQLRQKTGFALQQIVVVSVSSSVLRNQVYACSNYQDMLNTHAFGHYRDVLGFVNWSPIMGKWLSSLQNQKAADLDGDGSDDIFPDENLARENMQLFSIGLFELWPDGTLRLNGSGLPVPTYTNDDIREFARILTGQSFSRYNASSAGWGGIAYDSIPENNTFNRGQSPNGLLSQQYLYPMKMFGAFHDPGVKTFAGTAIDNTDIPDPSARGVADIEAAIDWLAGKPGDGQPDFDMVHSHRSTPAFISRRLIQRMVSSNPSRDYLHRVATVFKDNEGDLGLTVKAILLDPEARNVDLDDVSFGMKKSPLEGFIQVLRSLDAYTQIPITDPAGAYPYDTAPGDYSNPDLYLDNFSYPAGQIANQQRNMRFLYHYTITSGTSQLQMVPFRQETVFNWYLPDYAPGGPIAEAGLVSPEMQLANEPDVIRNINYFQSLARGSNGIYVNALGNSNDNQQLAFNAVGNDAVKLNDNVRLDRPALTSAFYPATAPTPTGGRTSESLADEALVDELDRRLTCGFFKRRYPYDPSDDDDPAVPGVDDLLKNPRELIIDAITAAYGDPYNGSNDDSDRLNKLSDALYLLTFSPEFQIKK